MRTRCVGWLFVLLVAAWWAAAGCSRGPSMGEVTGSVIVDGKPAQIGSITFFPVDGKSTTAGAPLEGGKYTAKVPVGNFKVDIRVSKVVARRKLYDTPDSPMIDEMAEVLPSRYNNDTELRLEVKPGKNEKDWDLKSK